MERGSLEREIREIEECKARKTIFRAKSNWTLYGEKPSKYFLNLQKRRQKNNSISVIFSEDSGVLLSSPKEILQEGKNFYQKLYQSRGDSNDALREMEDLIPTLDLPQLTEGERLKLDADLDPEELKRALAHLNTGKCPGSDGLPPKFYSRFWNALSPYLMEIIRFAVAEGLLSNEQRRGVITLVPKKEVDRRRIGSWRSIEKG